MKRTLTGLAAASLLIALPLAAAAHDDDHRGWNGYERHGPYYHQPNPKQYYRHDQPPVVYYPAAPRIVERPVYVSVPPPAPRPWPFNQVDIGFRIFF